nr:hypothetical protein [Glycomyces buryatensis]
MVETRCAVCGELHVDALSLDVDVLDLRGEFLGGPVGVAEQFDDLVFECVESGAFAFEVAAQGLRRAVVGGGSAGETGPGPRSFGGCEGDGGVVGGDGALDVGDGEPGQVAGAVLVAAQAEVVEVEAAGLGFGALDDQPAPAAPAPDEALEVVVPLAFAHARAVFLVEHGLDLVEQCGVDEGFVSAGVFGAVEGHVAEVVAVAEHLTDLADRERRTSRVLARRPGPQPRAGRELTELGEGALPGVVLLEEHLHQWCAFGIEGDGADLASVDGLADVEVAQRGFAGGATERGFGFHLVGDVLARDARLVLVEAVDHVRHEIPGGRVVGGVLHGQDRDAEASEFAFGEACVGGVAEQP